MSTDSVLLLKCGYQGYEWGKPGTASRVAAIQSSHSTSVSAAGTVPCAGILGTIARNP